MNQLEQARAQIDTVDRQMAALFEQRMAAVRQVIEYKQATGMPILDSGREAQVIEKNTAYIAEEVLRPFCPAFLRLLLALLSKTLYTKSELMKRESRPLP